MRILHISADYPDPLAAGQDPGGRQPAGAGTRAPRTGSISLNRVGRGRRRAGQASGRSTFDRWRRSDAHRALAYGGYRARALGLRRYLTRLADWIDADCAAAGFRPDLDPRPQAHRRRPSPGTSSPGAGGCRWRSRCRATPTLKIIGRQARPARPLRPDLARGGGGLPVRALGWRSDARGAARAARGADAGGASGARAPRMRSRRRSRLQAARRHR